MSSRVMAELDEIVKQPLPPPPTNCHNCGKLLKTAQLPHYLAGMPLCCPDCIFNGSCACP